MRNILFKTVVTVVTDRVKTNNINKLPVKIGCNEVVTRL